jgi:hypothetical protein
LLVNGGQRVPDEGVGRKEKEKKKDKRSITSTLPLLYFSFPSSLSMSFAVSWKIKYPFS